MGHTSREALSKYMLDNDIHGKLVSCKYDDYGRFEIDTGKKVRYYNVTEYDVWNQ